MLRDSYESLETQRQYIRLADAWAMDHGQKQLLEEYAKLRECLWNLDLSLAWPVLAELYSQRGRPAISPLLLLRISLAKRTIRVDSRDGFIDRLRLSPYLQILVGLGNELVPGASTLRDFERRTSKARRRGANLPIKKSDGGRKDLIARAASFLGHLRERTGTPKGVLNRILRQVVFEPALANGLVEPDSPPVVDGTFMESRTNPRGRKTCDHGRKRCDCPTRRYTDPLADKGHDHHEERTVYGHSLSVATTLTKENEALMLAITPAPASRHDGVTTLLTMVKTRLLYPELIGRYLLIDAASDNQSSPRLARNLGFKPIIPLRKPGKNGYHIKNIPFTAEGVPLCAAGHPMHPHGTVGSRQRWICPGELAKSGVAPHYPCHNLGFRTISFAPAEDQRLVSAVHRGSKLFRKLYARRSNIERSLFKPALSDSGLDRTRVQSRGRMAFDMMLEGIIGYARILSRKSPIPGAA